MADLPKLTGENIPIPWLAVKDVGEIVASAFSRPESYLGKSVVLVADVKTRRSVAISTGKCSEKTRQPSRCRSGCSTDSPAAM